MSAHAPRGPSVSPEATTPPTRILVVDDDVDACRNLTDILSDLGYVVETAHDGAAALEQIQQRHFDVAILDLKMPRMDGLTLYREIKRRRASTVAIIVTAYASDETAQQALQAGAWRVLSKPVDLERLMRLVGEASGQPLVMVVDDDLDLCDSMWDVLREAGYRVGIASDEAQAAELLAAARHQVVLLDMKFPRGTGHSMFHLVRRFNPEARVVLITGHRAELSDLVERTMAEGAEAACFKPFDLPQLLKTIESLAAAD